MKDITNLENKISEKGEDNSDNANPDNANPDNACKYKKKNKKKSKKGKSPTSKPIQVNESMTKKDEPELATKADGDVSKPKVIADSILNLCTQIKEDSPNTMVGVSALLTRNDKPVLATKVKQVNLILDNYCQMHKLPFLRNANINTSHLNNKGLHLIKQGSLLLQNNFIEFTENF